MITRTLVVDKYFGIV